MDPSVLIVEALHTLLRWRSTPWASVSFSCGLRGKIATQLGQCASPVCQRELAGAQ